MLIRPILTALILATVVSICVAQNGQCSPRAALCAPVELTLGDTSRRGTDFVLQYGLLRNDVATEVKIGVRNVLGESLPIRVATTSDVLLAWSDEKPMSQTLNAMFAKNQQRQMSISFRPAADDPIPIVRFSLGGVLIATLSLSFLAEDDRLPIQAGGSYAGSSAVTVLLCTGKPPLGYKLDCPSVKVNGEQPPYPTGTCAKNVSCAVSTAACGAVADQRSYYCIRVKPTPAAGVINFDALLTADYVLEDTSPKLMLLAEVEEANRLVQKKQKCADDWNHFLNQHKLEPQFQVMSEAGGTIHFRSEPCDPLQGSYIGLPAASDGKWVDLKYAGLRVKSLGGPFLVGIVGFGEPLFNNIAMERLALNEPGLSSTMEVMFIRDSKWVVATFALGGETPGETWGVIFGIGSSLTAFDNPPPGMHTYTAKVRYIGSQKSANLAPMGQFIAYELPKGGSR